MKTIYNAVMIMKPAVTRQDIQGTLEKLILYDIPNVYHVEYMEKRTFIEHHQKKKHP